MPAKARTITPKTLWVAFTAALLIFVCHFCGFVDFREADAFDFRIKIRGEKPAHQDLVLVEIDDQSLAAFGEWPWARSVHAVLIEALAQHEPRAVFFDILFTEPGADLTADDHFRIALEKLDHVILPFFFYSAKPFRAVFPIDSFREAASHVGFVNVEPDRDGITRRFRVSVDTEEGAFFHPSVFAVLPQGAGEEAAKKLVESLPLDEEGKLWINYPGSITAFERISFWEVIDALGKRDGEMHQLFEGKTVLVGQTATGTTDLKPTPFLAAEPGVSIQASAMHTMLTRNFFRSSHWMLDLLFIVILSLGVAWVVYVKTPRQGLLATVMILLVFATANVLLFIFARLILPLFLPVVTMIAVYVVTLFMRYVEVLFQGELLSRELETASRIQENFLPQTLPNLKGLDVAFQCRFAKQVGGDLYDWVELGKDRLGVCVGDVSGKGVPAALYMAKAISEFRRENKSELQPGELNYLMNESLSRGGSSGMFLTLLYAVINLGDKKVSLSSAGHDPMIFYRSDDKQAKIINGEGGTPLGLFEGMQYGTSEVDFKPGDLFVVVSDGIKELRNPKKEEFGMDRLTKVIEEGALQTKRAQEIIDNVFNAMNIYQKGALAHDDRTILCVRFN